MQNQECSESSREVLAWWPGCTEKEWPKESGCQGTASGGDDTALRLKEEKQCMCGQGTGHFRQSVVCARLRIHKIRYWVQVMYEGWQGTYFIGGVRMSLDSKPG